MTQLTKDNWDQIKQQYQQNPLFNRAEQMAQGKSTQDLEQIARNLCQLKGLNFDEAWQRFQQQFFH